MEADAEQDLEPMSFRSRDPIWPYWGLPSDPAFVPDAAYQVSRSTTAHGVDRFGGRQSVGTRTVPNPGRRLHRSGRRFGDPPDPLFVVRRVGHQARVESFDGTPYSGLMSVEDAIEALREALQQRGG